MRLGFTDIVAAPARSPPAAAGKGIAMKMHLLAAVCALGLFGAVQTATAREACPEGGYTTRTCLGTLSGLVGRAGDLKSCVLGMDGEYNGRRGHGKGRGVEFDGQLDDCATIAQEILDKLNKLGASTAMAASAVSSGSGFSVDSADGGVPPPVDPSLRRVALQMKAWAKKAH